MWRSFSNWYLLVTSILSLLFIPIAPSAGDDAASGQFTAPLERVSVTLDFDNRNWVLGYSEHKVLYSLLEWVPKGETVDDWSQYFAVIRTQRKLLRYGDLKTFTDAFRHRITHSCENQEAITFKTIEQTDNSALVVWEMTGCISDMPMTGDQKEIARFIQNDEFLFELSFVVKPTAQNADYKRWLSALRGAEIKAHALTSQAADLSVQLANIPLEQQYIVFTPGPRDKSKAMLIPSNYDSRGTKFNLKTSGLPVDHWYAVWIIITPGRDLMPLISGLRVGDAGALVCPEPVQLPPGVVSVTSKPFVTNLPPVLACSEHPGEPFDTFINLSAVGYQKGLAFAIGIQSHDGDHVVLAKGFDQPIAGISNDCRLQLELASLDGRTYVLRGDGFTPGEAVSIEWTYSRYESKLKVPAQGDGSFAIPLFHTKKAKGSNKWNGNVTATGASCQPGFSYEWGKRGMRH